MKFHSFIVHCLMSVNDVKPVYWVFVAWKKATKRVHIVAVICLLNRIL